MLANDDDDDDKNTPSSMELLKYMIGNLTSTWSDIVSNFKTETKTELKEILTGRGFSYFSQKLETDTMFGIEASAYSKVIEMLLSTLDVPEKHKTKITCINLY